MKKIAVLVILTLACSMLWGCQISMDGSYHSVKPHVQPGTPQVQQNAEAKTYLELRDIMQNLVETGTQNGLIFVDSMTADKVEAYMQMSIKYLTQIHAIGSYAVDEITYELGTNSGRQAAAVTISYIHGKAEILRLQEVANMDGVMEMVYEALEGIDSGVVLLVRNYEKRDIAQLIQNYVDQNPRTCMEIPQVTVTSYPATGTERVLQLSFSYQTDRDMLRNMQELVRPVFSSAELYVRGDAAAWEKYAQLYSFLMERYDYTIETSITPSYSLLRHGVGDSKAFATVYSAMCRQAGLECSVVSGTRGGESWYWNAILYEGEYYYVDLLACSAVGDFTPKTFHEMTGYVWDYSAHGQESPPNGITPPDPTDPSEPTEPEETTEPSVEEPNEMEKLEKKS